MSDRAKLTKFERLMLIEDCRDALRNVHRTSEESEAVRTKAKAACEKLGIDHPEDAI